LWDEVDIGHDEQIRLAVIHHGQKLLVQFPGDGHGAASFQIFHASGDFFVPCFFYRIVGLIVGMIKAVEEGVGQSRAFINGERQGAF